MRQSALGKSGGVERMRRSGYRQRGARPRIQLTKTGKIYEKSHI